MMALPHMPWNTPRKSSEHGMMTLPYMARVAPCKLSAWYDGDLIWLGMIVHVLGEHGMRAMPRMVRCVSCLHFGCDTMMLCSIWMSHGSREYVSMMFIECGLLYEYSCVTSQNLCI